MKDKVDAAPASNGPIADRKCRDVVWLILFGLFWIGMFAIAGVGIRKGDLKR